MTCLEARLTIRRGGLRTPNVSAFVWNPEHYCSHAREDWLTRGLDFETTHIRGRCFMVIYRPAASRRVGSSNGTIKFMYHKSLLVKAGINFANALPTTLKLTWILDDVKLMRRAFFAY